MCVCVCVCVCVFVCEHVPDIIRNDKVISMVFFKGVFVEFAKLRASRVLVLYLSSRFVSYAPSCLMRLRALRTFVPYASSHLTWLTHTPCAPISSALHALFVRLKSFLGWICSPTETFHFPRTIKDTTKCTVFMWFKKETVVKHFKWGNYLSIFKTWNQFNVFVFFFSSFSNIK